MINPITLLLQLKNEMGPQLATATGELQAFKGEVAATSAEASGLSAALGSGTGIGLVAILGAAGVAAIGFGAAMAMSASHMMELADQVEALGPLSNEFTNAEKNAMKFHDTITEATDRLGAMRDRIINSDGVVHAVQSLADAFNNVSKWIDNVSRAKVPEWLVVLARGHMGEHGGGASWADDSGFANGDSEPFIRTPKKPKQYGGVSISDYIAGAGRGPDAFDGLDLGLRGGGDDPKKTLDALIKVQGWLKEVKVPADAFSASLEQYRKTAQAVSHETVMLGRDVLAGTRSIGNAFRTLVADILTAIVQQKVESGITNFVLGLLPGGNVISGLKNGSGAQRVTVNVNAMSAKDVIRSVQSGELYEANRYGAISARLP